MTGAAWNYHLRTGYDPHDMGGDRLDRGIQPHPFKDYPGLEKIVLPSVVAGPEDTLPAVLDDRRSPDPTAELDQYRLARILFLTHALTGQVRYGSEVFYFRSVPSAGALYPFELYVAVRGVAGLEDGLYHHDVRDQSLIRLRYGNRPFEIAESLQGEQTCAPVLAFFLTSIFFRSSWKYRDRAYRYNLLDTGHLAENLALALRSEKLAFQIQYDFDDAAINHMLGVAPEREGCLAVVLVSGKAVSTTSDSTTQHVVAKDLTAASKVSPREVEYPAIREIHAACSKIFREQKEIDMFSTLGVTVKQSLPIPRPEKWPEAMTYQEAVMNRRSMRNFVRQELPADHLGSLLSALCCNIEAGADLQHRGAETIAVGLLTGRVAGLTPSFYLLDRKREALVRVVSGHSLTAEMSRACLGQGWLADCSLHFLFLCNLELLENTWGPRGYRYAMLTAGRLGQRLYLAATSLRLGCCGIGAFYDREAASLLAIGENTSLLYLVAVGQIRLSKM